MGPEEGRMGKYAISGKGRKTENLLNEKKSANFVSIWIQFPCSVDKLGNEANY